MGNTASTLRRLGSAREPSGPVLINGPRFSPPGFSCTFPNPGSETQLNFILQVRLVNTVFGTGYLEQGLHDLLE